MVENIYVRTGQISLVWSNIKNNRRTAGLLSLDNWRGVNLWRNKQTFHTGWKILVPRPVCIL